MKICKCGSATVEKKAKIIRTVNRKRVTFNNVPVSVCTNCNEQYLSAKTLKQMDRLLFKNEGKSEINYDIDPKELYMIKIIEKMKEQKIILPDNESDMPVTISDLGYAFNRLRELKLCS